MAALGRAIYDLPRQVVRNLRVVAQRRQERDPEELLLALAQLGADPVADGRRAELALTGGLAGDEQDDRVRAAGAQHADVARLRLEHDVTKLRRHLRPAGTPR